VDKACGRDHISLAYRTMKIPALLSLLYGLALPLAAATTTPPPAPAKPATPTPKTHASASAHKPSSAASKPAVAAAQAATPTPPPAPAPAPAPKPTVTLDDYMAALTAALSLSKDEQTSVRTSYLDDGPKLQDILNDPSVSPLEQTQEVDALREARNEKIEALLHDAGRQQKFLQVEANYRVALIELAADGGFFPFSPPSPPPASAAKTPPAT
jgi:hypothetical protein